ncbi:spore protease YyaC [Anaerocolumna cellulosilytica]|uniref:Spore protease YyaC n=1 Tax=Anaerocolumna cellulosilytica TaxID=433286 RepID=A0A6S6RCZ2_9FIRM|nr:spore protease YyaC [Anaerocolumna cellulosilytica]MBB5195815.1 putative sporulation protein YyaC [Anaerocolumna cellulosilytica]BCJ96825.1 spore protease YyaC [Anaerocolumna cellulosilytica]
MSRELGIEKKLYYFNTKDRYSVYDFSRTLHELIQSKLYKNRQLVFLCIGSDRATGDCLGPIVGYKLSKLKQHNIALYGTLEQPVHAKNLSETISYIKTHHRNAFVIAIDASLGKSGHIGYITLGEGPLLPGAGVDKELPPVGDIFITGIVNFSGMLDHMLLQTTRLNIVMILADYICSGINYCFYKLGNK